MHTNFTNHTALTVTYSTVQYREERTASRCTATAPHDRFPPLTTPAPDTSPRPSRALRVSADLASRQQQPEYHLARSQPAAAASNRGIQLRVRGPPYPCPASASNPPQTHSPEPSTAAPNSGTEIQRHHTHSEPHSLRQRRGLLTDSHAASVRVVHSGCPQMTTSQSFLARPRNTATV
jgi:hypothetical protein